jgi:hypothetical protein
MQLARYHNLIKGEFSDKRRAEASSRDLQVFKYSGRFLTSLMFSFRQTYIYYLHIEKLLWENQIFLFEDKL